MIHAERYFSEVSDIARLIDRTQLAALADAISGINGRLFIAGLGGSAANASHACNDFRKLSGIEAHCLSDNVSELTARANDDGWQAIYSGGLNALHAAAGDALLVLSVGGGTEEVSVPLVKAIDYAKLFGMKVFGILGRDGGYTAKNADVAVIVPTVSSERVTPHTEAFQSVILHYLVSHPAIQKRATKW